MHRLPWRRWWGCSQSPVSVVPERPRALDDGVSADSIKIGYVTSQTGVAGSTFQNADKGCKARVERENAKGGVNGRKVEVEYVDDQSAQNLTAVQNLVQNDHVFMVVNNSPFAFLGYRFLLDQGVPMIGGGYDGVYYGDPGNEGIISASGNVVNVNGVSYDLLPKVMKKMGAKKVAALAYGVSASSTAAAQNLQKLAVPEVGLDAVYTNTTLDFGTTDVGPVVLGIKNAGADAVYLPMVANSNLAVVQGLQQNGVAMKSEMLATGYGQDLLDQPAAQTFGPRSRDADRSGAGRAQDEGDEAVPGRPEEVRRHDRHSRLRHLHRLHELRARPPGSEERREPAHAVPRSLPTSARWGATTVPAFRANRSTSAPRHSARPRRPTVAGSSR